MYKELIGLEAGNVYASGMLSPGSTPIGAHRGLTVKGPRPFDAGGDLFAQLFGVAPQPLRLVAQALQFFQTLFVLREHNSV